MTEFLYTSAAALIWGAAIVKLHLRPFRWMKCIAADAEALVILLGLVVYAAWAERRKWPECREQARREWS